MSTRTRKDLILWGALGCALVSTAHAEYTLATAAHFNEYVALAVPGALDLYVVRALQQRRDVLAAVLAMVAANVTSHLITGGVLVVGWPVIAAVGAVAPLIVWRVYALKYGTGAVSTPVLETDTPQVSDMEPVLAPAPDRVPDWMRDEYEETYVPDKASTPPVPYLRSVPALPTEYVHASTATDTASTPVLKASDLPYLAGAREYADKYEEPTVRGLMRALRVGQDRATRLLDHLEVES